MDLPATPMFAWLLLAGIPLLVAACTAFTKVSVVLAAVRIGLGAESLLPYVVVVTLSVLATSIIMAPTAIEVAAAVEEAGGLKSVSDAGPGVWWTLAEPLQRFMADHADVDEIAFFSGLYGVGDSHPLALIPGFLITELGEALYMAVLILLPFVVIDLIVAQLLTLLSMQQQSVAAISLPAKILLFLAAGGWDLILGGLIGGYR